VFHLTPNAGVRTRRRRVNVERRSNASSEDDDMPPLVENPHEGVLSSEDERCSHDEYEDNPSSDVVEDTPDWS